MSEIKKIFEDLKNQKNNLDKEIDLKQWRKYQDDITTSALWIEPIQKQDSKFVIPKRKYFPKNDSDFHGLFIPEIPYQFMKRFTKVGETVWDCFGGSGTTKRVADILKRECIINDLTPQQSYIQQGDSINFNPGKNVQLLFMHPPYHDIIKYSEKEDDGSNQESVKGFLKWFEEVVINVTKYVDDNRFLVLVCGNIYSEGEEITLGVYCKDIVRQHGFTLKSHIIKEYGEVKSLGNTRNLQYYRALKGNYNQFYGDNIFLLQKRKSKSLNI